MTIEQNTTYEKYRTIIATSGYSPVERDLLLWVCDTAETEKWSVDQLARNIGYSATVVGRVLSDKYSAQIDPVMDRIRSFRDKIVTKSFITDIPFVETPISKLVWQAIDYSINWSEIVSIIGNSQWGKTTAIEEYKRRRDRDADSGNVIIIRMPVRPSILQVVNLLATAMGISKRLRFERTKERIKLQLTPRHVIIVDECHQASMGGIRGKDSIEILREIYDATKCGLVLVGTNVWGLSLNGNSGDDKSAIKGLPSNWDYVMKQTMLRGINVTLPPRLSYDDMQSIWTAFGFTDPNPETPAEAAALKTVKNIVATHGLGRYVKRLRSAVTAANRSGAPVTWGHFLAVHKQLEQLAGITND